MTAPKAPNFFAKQKMPRNNFLPPNGNHLSLSVPKTRQHARATPTPLLGSIPTTPSWRFPSQGTTNRSWVDWSTTPMSPVYFDPVLSTPAPTGLAGNYEKLTNPLYNISTSSSTNHFTTQSLAESPSNDILANLKDALLQQIQEQESDLMRDQLIHQIRLKETQLQGLLQEGVQFQAPVTGRWKIESQVLDGKEVPAGQWILPDGGPQKPRELGIMHNQPAIIQSGLIGR